MLTHYILSIAYVMFIQVSQYDRRHESIPSILYKELVYVLACVCKMLGRGIQVYDVFES